MKQNKPANPSTTCLFCGVLTRQKEGGIWHLQLNKNNITCNYLLYNRKFTQYEHGCLDHKRLSFQCLPFFSCNRQLTAGGSSSIAVLCGRRACVLNKETCELTLADFSLNPSVFYLTPSPQATYVLLALAWVFVPVYISSGVGRHTQTHTCTHTHTGTNLLVQAGSAGTFWCQEAFPQQGFLVNSPEGCYCTALTHTHTHLSTHFIVCWHIYLKK